MDHVCVATKCLVSTNGVSKKSLHGERKSIAAFQYEQSCKGRRNRKVKIEDGYARRHRMAGQNFKSCANSQEYRLSDCRPASCLVQDGGDLDRVGVIAVLLGRTDLVTLSGQRVLDATVVVVVADLTNEILGGESVEAVLV